MNDTKATRRILIVALFLFGFQSCLYFSFGQSATLIDTASAGFKIGELEYLQTKEITNDTKKINELYRFGSFTSDRHVILNEGIADTYYWIHFDITNASTATNDITINLDNARLNDLQLFELSTDSLRALGRLGDFFPFNQRTVLHKTFLYQLTLAPKQKKEYFLFVNQVGHAFVLPIKVFNSKKFSSTTFKDYLFDGVTYGILLFVALLSFIFFVTSKYRLYLYYSLYIITAILWFLSYFGLGYQYLWPASPSFNTFMPPFMAALNVLLNLQICQSLLELSTTRTALNTLTNITKGMLAMVAVFPVIIDLNQHSYVVNLSYLLIFLCLILFAMVMVVVLVCFYAWKGLRTAKFYLLASLLKAVSIFHLALLELGVTGAIYNTEAVLQLGIFVEIGLLTYALASRYTNFRVKTFEKVIEAHEKERSLISKEIHDGISSSLTGINYGIKNFTRDISGLQSEKIAALNTIFDELNKVQVEARNISHNTMPDYIKNASISEIVKKHVEEIQNKINNAGTDDKLIQINFSANKQLTNFSEAVKLNIFRIVQELLINILKHSGAKNADIIFSFTKKETTIIAEDDGVGFFYKKNNEHNGMGIKNLESRVDLLDGKMTVSSFIHSRPVTPSSAREADTVKFGTLITIKIPHKNRFVKSTGYDY